MKFSQLLSCNAILEKYIYDVIKNNQMSFKGEKGDSSLT